MRGRELEELSLPVVLAAVAVHPPELRDDRLIEAVVKQVVHAAANVPAYPNA